MKRTAAPDLAMPMVEMNTTPLIDVLLVLLVMFIITIPIQSHAVKLDLPRPCERCPQPNAAKNEIVITRSGPILWNGVSVTENELRYELSLTQRMRPVPELHLRPDPDARYDAVDKVLVAIKRENVSKVGFVGNERYLNI